MGEGGGGGGGGGGEWHTKGGHMREKGRRVKVISR